jgi:hypothetical protein
MAHPLAPEILSKLKDAFEKKVFEASLASLSQTSNPLRLNNFATNIRELSRIILYRLAPDEQVKACTWYIPAQAKSNISRAQRITYSVQAGLAHTFVTGTLQLDVEAMQKELLCAIDQLNKFTHVGPHTFGISGTDLDKMETETLEAFLAFLDMMDQCREEVESAVLDHAEQALHDELLSRTITTLDELATHYNVEDAVIDSVKVDLMDATHIVFMVAGYVNCRLQYGSESDQRNDIGAVMNDSFPLKCEFEGRLATPLKVQVKPNTLEIDTSSFYE